MKKALIVVTVLSVSLNLLLVAAIANQSFGIPVAEAIKNIDTPGTYGPPAMEIIDGDATVSTNDVVLQNLLITGNLYLTAEVNQGTVALNKVQVQGEVIIAGGNFTLKLADCTLAKITVQQESGAVKVVASGSSSVTNVSVAAETSLQEDALNEGAQGFCNVQVQTDQKTILVGEFDAVDIHAKKANVKALKGSVVAINVKDTAADSVVNLAGDVQAETVSINAIMTLAGEGKVQTADVNVPGLVILQGELGEVACRAEGIFLELRAGSVAKIIVPELEHATSINLAENTAVEEMELNARTGVTGKGTIGTVVINHAGVTIDQMPVKIIIPENLVAMIAGEEYKAEPKPEPEPEPEPEPPKPSVKISKISKIDPLMIGKSAARTISVQPSGAALTVTSSNSKVAAVSLSGNTVTITGKGSGKATITVKGTKSGYISAARTFTVEVRGPMDVKEFKVYDPLVPGTGKKTVVVFLYADNPSIYKVSVAGVRLTYLSEKSCFYGEVPEADAKQSKVKVSK